MCKRLLFSCLGLLTLMACQKKDQPSLDLSAFPVWETRVVMEEEEQLFFHIDHDIPIRRYFEFMDSLVGWYNNTLTYPITEHLIVRANPWLVDTLVSTDYYRMMARDSFVYDPQSLVVLHRGDSLLIPDSVMVDSLYFRLAATVIDVNIPEYKLRIIEAGEVSHVFAVRVGRNERKFLAMAGDTVDLRTRPGAGFVYRVERSPIFINPSNNHRYTSTRRDDDQVTLLPRIPWLDVEIDGQRYGQLLHPTTNINTLGRAYSNGCVGISEAAAWRLYYSAPVGTKVFFRYDLEVVDEWGDTILLRDIYPGFERISPLRWKPAQAAFWPAHPRADDCSPGCWHIFGPEGEEYQEAK